MQSKHRIAILVSLLFAVPAAVAALEQAAPSAIAESVESRADAQPAEEPAAQAVAGNGEQVIGTAPDGGLVRAMPSDAYPKGSDVEWEMPPVQLAYFERLERQRGPLVARGDVFPKGSDVEWEMPPVQLAYFDRVESQRLANSQPATQAAESVPAADPAGEPRSLAQKAGDYISGLLRRDSAGAPADSTTSASNSQ